MDIKVDLISIDQDTVKGAHGIEILSNLNIDDIREDRYDGIVLPGGLPGASNLRDDKRVVDLVRKIDEEKMLIAAICAAPIVLAKAGLIENRRLTAYPGFEEDLKDGNYRTEKYVVDGNIITGRGPYYAVDFALAIVEYLLGKNCRESLEKDILYKEI